MGLSAMSISVNHWRQRFMGKVDCGQYRSSGAATLPTLRDKFRIYCSSLEWDSVPHASNLRARFAQRFGNVLPAICADSLAKNRQPGFTDGTTVPRSLIEQPKCSGSEGLLRTRLG
jgi:hypothetical protein